MYIWLEMTFATNLVLIAQVCMHAYIYILNIHIARPDICSLVTWPNGCLGRRAVLTDQLPAAVTSESQSKPAHMFSHTHVHAWYTSRIYHVCFVGAGAIPPDQLPAAVTAERPPNDACSRAECGQSFRYDVHVYAYMYVRVCMYIYSYINTVEREKE